jgi:hypothetical protein
MSTYATARSLARMGARTWTLALLLACGKDDSAGSVATVSQAWAQTPSTSAFQNATAQALPSVVYIQDATAVIQRGPSEFSPEALDRRDRQPSRRLLDSPRDELIRVPARCSPSEGAVPVAPFAARPIRSIRSRVMEDAAIQEAAVTTSSLPNAGLLALSPDLARAVLRFTPPCNRR